MTKQLHKYAYQIKSESAPFKVIRMVGRNQRVLELGPGPGSITKHLKDNDCRITALELDAEAITLVTEFCERVIPCNLNDSNWASLLDGEEKFSVIVAADVLEHLYDPWATLKMTLPLLAPSGCVVISLPHAAHSSVLACLLNEDFAYQPWGLLDSTHIRFWGLKNMQQLFVDAGFKIVDAEFVVTHPEQTELAYYWHRLPASSRAVLAESRFGNVYQVVIRAIPADAAGKALQLDSLAVPIPASSPVGDYSVLRGLLRRLGSHLDPDSQTKIVRILRRFRLWP